MKVLRARAANEFNLFSWFEDNFLHAAEMEEETPPAFIERAAEPLSAGAG